MHKITVITVTFNLIKDGREAFFRQCVESVHNQTYPNIEHIVMDGASTDGTLDLIREYEEKGWLKCYSEPDEGMVDAMNKGIKKASGEYIAILNSDDWYEKNALELLMRHAITADADYSYGITDMLSRDGKNKLAEMGEKNVSLFFIRIPFNHEAMLCKKSTYKALEFYNWKTYDTIADYDFIQRMILADYKGVFVNACVLKFRMDGTTNVSSKDKRSIKYKMHIKHLYKMYMDFFFKFTPEFTHSKLRSIFENKDKYLDSNDFKYITSDEIMYYFIKWISEKHLKYFPYDDLFQTLLKYHLSEMNEFINRPNPVKQSASTTYIKLCGIPFLKIKSK